MSILVPGTAAAEEAVTTCKQLAFQTMADLGCEVFFNLPGRGIYTFLEGLADFPQIDYVSALHESALLTMADGYSRANGRRAAFVGLYMSSGTLNASSGVFLAQRDRIPLVMIATQTESWGVGAGARAEASSITEIMRPLTKWAIQVPRADRVGEILRRAATIATTPPMGPVFVALPVDFHDELVPAVEAGTLPVVPPASPHAAALAEVAAAIRRAERPALVVGAEALSAGAGEAARRICEEHGIVLLAEPDPPALPAPDDHPFYGGVFAEAEELLADCDLVVSLGVNTYEPGHRQVAGLARVPHIQLGTDGSELAKVFPATIALWGDLRWLCESLEAALAGQPAGHDAWRRRIADYRRAEREGFDTRAKDGWDDSPISAARLFTTLAERLPQDALVVEQSCTMTGYLRSYMRFEDGENYLGASGSCQGWGLGAAIGAQVAQPDRTVVAVVGDGGFMFAVQALWSAIQYKLPVVIVVVNNGGWLSMRGSLRRGAPQLASERGQLGFGWDGDYAALARSLGAEAATVHDPGELDAAIDAACRSEGPYLLDVHVRHEAKLYSSPTVAY